LTIWTSIKTSMTSHRLRRPVQAKKVEEKPKTAKTEIKKNLNQVNTDDFRGS